jgi:hypothetical protein
MLVIRANSVMCVCAQDESRDGYNKAVAQLRYARMMPLCKTMHSHLTIH